MRTVNQWIVAAMVVAGACAAAARGEATLAGANLGEYAGGPAITAADLKGRVVLFEYWGVNCGPCLANIPHVTEMQKKYPREQFIVVANHCQDGGAANAGAVWSSRSHENIVSVINQGNLPGGNVTSIPRCFLFDATGKLIFDGHPSEVGPKVDQAVKSSPGFLVAGHEFKVLARDAASIGAMRSNLSGTIKRLRTAAANEKNPAACEEAKYLLDRLTEWSDTQYATCTAKPVNDPASILETTRKMVSLLRGDELGNRWAELDKSLKQDKSFQNEMKAAQVLNIIEQQAFKGPLFGEGQVGESRLASEKAVLRSQLEELARRYPDTAAAKKAGQSILFGTAIAEGGWMKRRAPRQAWGVR
ncbi:MAG: TlpA family protein disulfide reductase [Phycisphaerales bacterium]